MRCYRIIGCTEKGPMREANEDHILIGRFVKNRGQLMMVIDHEDDFLTNYGLLLAVADGVGGAAGGAMASKLALTALERQFYGVEKTDGDTETFIGSVKSAAARANETILAVASKRPDLAGMGCTLSGICLMPHGYLVFNAGDSRVYRFRDGLKQLTRDDSLSNLAVRAGLINLNEAETSHSRHTITNCLGSESFELKIDLGRELRDNDTFLICSDGLHDLISDDEMENVLAGSQDVISMATRLIDRAISHGGRDNISAIIACSGVAEIS